MTQVNQGEREMIPTEKVGIFPINEGFNQFDVLPDGMLLYEQTQEGEGRAPGIYRYDPEGQTFSLVVSDTLSAILFDARTVMD